MNRSATVFLAATLVLTVPAIARAELVRFATGRVMSVDTARIDGDSVVIVLREGGEMRVPRDVIAEILPDEVPHPKPGSEAAAAAPQVPDPATPAPDAIHALVDRLAGALGVPLKLAHAIVEVESNYQPNAISRAGAMGLMQIMPDVAKDYAVRNPFDPEQNVTAGLSLLKDLLARFNGDVKTALAAYNAGEGAVAKYRGVPPYPETIDYVQRVMALAKRP